MAKFLLFILLFTGSLSVTAQHIYLEKGRSMTSFIYKNAAGEVLEGLQESNHDFMALGYRGRFLNENLNGFIGVAYAGYGAIGSNPAVNGILEWNANYLEINTGLDCNLFSIRKLKLYARLMFSTGIFIQGVQRLDDQIFSLNGQREFKDLMTDFRYGAGAILPASKSMSFYVQYLIGKSFNRYGDVQKESLRIKSHNLSFGVLISVRNENKKKNKNVVADETKE